MGLHHWVQHPIVHHLPAQAILILHLSLAPGKKKEDCIYNSIFITGNNSIYDLYDIKITLV
jgi:hypothetical protein